MGMLPALPCGHADPAARSRLAEAEAATKEARSRLAEAEVSTAAVCMPACAAEAQACMHGGQ